MVVVVLVVVVVVLPAALLLLLLLGRRGEGRGVEAEVVVMLGEERG